MSRRNVFSQTGKPEQSEDTDLLHTVLMHDPKPETKDEPKASEQLEKFFNDLKKLYENDYNDEWENDKQRRQNLESKFNNAFLACKQASESSKNLFNLLKEWVKRVCDVNVEKTIENARVQLSLCEFEFALCALKLKATTTQGLLANAALEMHNEIEKAKTNNKITEDDRPKLTNIMNCTIACLTENKSENTKAFNKAIDEAEKAHMSIGDIPWEKTKIRAICLGIGAILLGSLFIGLSLASLVPSWGWTAPFAIAGINVGWNIIAYGATVLAGIGIAAVASSKLENKSPFFKYAEEFKDQLSPDNETPKSNPKSKNT